MGLCRGRAAHVGGGHGLRDRSLHNGGRQRPRPKGHIRIHRGGGGVVLLNLQLVESPPQLEHSKGVAHLLHGHRARHNLHGQASFGGRGRRRPLNSRVRHLLSLGRKHGPPRP